MSSISFITNWWRFGPHRNGPASTQLVDAGSMWEEIDRERSRSDRNGASLCLLVFPVTAPQVEPLADRLLGRIRATDTAGHLGRRMIGVILPETPREGAQVLAGHLRDMYEADEAPTIRIYEHPFSDSQVKSAAGEKPTNYDGTPRGRGDRRRFVDDAYDDVVEIENTDDHPIHAMEALTAQRLPLWKRTLDICGATFGLVALSPLLTAAAVAVKLSSPGPIFFHQQRAGLAAAPFTMWKFRTMVANAEEIKDELRHLNEQDGPAFKIANDPRVTRVGHWLRKLNIDELPQLYNVLRGEMSLVGPRPLPVEESRACHLWHRRRLDVTPGLTCYWQVKPRRNDISFDDWVRMDVRYVRSRTLWSDLRLIGQTISNILFRSKDEPLPERANLK